MEATTAMASDGDERDQLEGNELFATSNHQLLAARSNTFKASLPRIDLLSFK